MTSIRLVIRTALVGLVAGCGAANINAASAPTGPPHQTTDPNLDPVYTGTPGPVDNAPYNPADPFSCATQAKEIPSLCSPTAGAAAVPTPVPAPDVTAGQANAAAEAAQYLSEGNGWSRAGLIAQLDSPYGGQYSKADATYGVDSQGVDWNAQAVLAAKTYLATSPFSRNALIAQLDSPYGGQFTKAQAVYGADHAGL